jgi:hypothetical protein
VLRFLVRAVGLIALAAAFAAAVIDGTRSIANSEVSLTPLGAALGQLAPAKLAQLPALAARISPKLWDPVLIHVLWVPTSLALAVVGFVLMALAAPRRQR